MNKISFQYYSTEIGELLLASFNDQLCMLDYKNRKARSAVDNRLKKGLKAVFVEQDNDVLKLTRLQLDEFFKGQRHQFEIPLLMVGTDFQKSVWHALLKVPYGTTTSYSAIANSINNVKAVRAVANANGANSIGIIIPCHRIIGLNGALVGYAGGLEAKEHLLNLEKNNNN